MSLPNPNAEHSADALDPIPCPSCGSPWNGMALFCPDCGFIFPAREDPPSTASFELPALPPDGLILRDRYRLREIISDRLGVLRFTGEDLRDNEARPVSIRILRQRIDEEAPDPPQWPSLAWEAGILARVDHSSLPRVLDQFTEDGYEYLIEDVPQGQSLWDAWDAPNATTTTRFDHLIQIAHALRALHEAGAQIEGLRPELVMVTLGGLAVIHDLTDLLPLPLTAGVQLRGTPYSAPELLLTPDHVDARADLYGFGAMLYALLLGRELTEIDFWFYGTPKPYPDRFPDAHPMLGRLLGRTFCRDPGQRFPTKEFAEDDPTGFDELIRVLTVCGRELDRVRLEVGVETTTGVVRAGNEDAVAVVRGLEGVEDEFGEIGLILLADGMGGMEKGEVAAALAVRTLRDYLIGRPASDDAPDTGGDALGAFWQSRIIEALKEANRRVLTAAQEDPAARGMGCTAEVVVLDGRRAIVGHVGDSRVYHLRGREIKQLTRDHTIVNRWVEMGDLTPEEAEVHPRRSELHQAIGGREDVDPDVMQVRLRPGDWLLVSSDGLTTQLTVETIQAILEQSRSAEQAARRLVNRALVEGAIDNVTVAVLRVL